MDVIPFDLYRIMVGEQPPLFMLEVIFRTAIMYGYTLLAVRFMGKRGMGQLTPFEFVVIIALGSAVGDPMLYADVPLLYGITIVTVIVLMQRFLNGATNMSPRLEEVVESKTIQLIDQGSILEAALHKEGMSKPELLMQLRMKGIKNTGEIELAFLEPSGALSIFKYPAGKELVAESTMPTSAVA